MPGLFDSAWLKWGWAVLHADGLQAEIGAFGIVSQSAYLYTNPDQIRREAPLPLERIKLLGGGRMCRLAS